MILRSGRIINMPDQANQNENENQNDNEEQEANEERNLRVIKTEAAKPFTFSGSTDDVKDFFERFNECCHFNNWRANETTRALPLYLKGDAKVFYRTLEQEVKDDMQQLEERFIEKFDTPESRWQLRTELFSLRQSDDLDAYISKLTSITQKLNTDDQTKLDLFIQGLKPSLKKHILMSQPRDFEAAVRTAKMKDSFTDDTKMDKLVDKFSKLMNEQTERLNYIQHPAARRANEPGYGRRTYTDRDFQELQEEVRRLKRNKYRPPFPPNYPRSTRTTNAQVVCNYCYRVGHTSHTCRRLNLYDNPKPNRYDQHYNDPRIPKEPVKPSYQALPYRPRQALPWKVQPTQRWRDQKSDNKQQVNVLSKITKSQEYRQELEERTPYYYNAREWDEFAQIDGMTEMMNTLSTNSFDGRQHDVIFPEENKAVTLEGEILRQPVTILLDSGATISVIKNAFWKELTNNTDVRIQEHDDLYLLGAGGTQIKVFGKVKLDVILAGEKYPQEFHIVNTLSNNVILGEDFLLKYEAIINFSKKEVTLVPPTHEEIAETDDDVNQTIQEDDSPEIKALNLITASSPNLNVKCLTLEEPVYQPPTTDNEVWQDSFPLQLDCPDLTEADKAKLFTLIHTNRDVFALDASELGRTNVCKHRIDIKDATPVKQNPYRVSPAQREELDKHIDLLIEQDMIRPSVSSWASPILLVPKPHSTALRMCIDYRKLNSVTNKDSHPLPRIDTILDSLHGAKFFTTLDLMCGYWQIEMEEESKDKTAFVSHRGLFEFNVMPFGLSSAVATFSRTMNFVLQHIPKSYCLVYLDDIIVFSNTIAEHCNHLQEVFNALRKANMKLKPSKCSFAKTSTKFLGHVVSADGIRPHEDNVKAVREFPTPSKPKQVRSFMGLCAYYRRFIKDFAYIAKPLYDLTKKEASFTWTTECEKAFNHFKTILTSEPLLAYPNFRETFYLYTDASNKGIGFTLGQKYDGKEFVILYGGRIFHKSEKNFSTTEKECLAVVAAVQKVRPYVYGTKFIIITDHSALRWLLSIKDPTGRLARWAMILQVYDFEIQYRPGRQHGNADALSRRYDDDTEDTEEIPKENESNTQLALADSLTAPNATKKPLIISTLSLKNLKDLQNTDSKLKLKMEILRSRTSPEELPNNQDNRNYHMKDGILYYQNIQYDDQPRLVVPDSIKHEILLWNHDHPFAGHFGIEKTYDRIKKHYFWPNMYHEIDNWVKSCLSCAMKNTPTNIQKAPLLPIAVSGPFEQVSVDIIGPITPSLSGNRYIVVFTDRLTKWVEARALASTEAPTIAKVFLDDVIYRHGIPRTLLSDRGKQFLSQFMLELCKLINTEKINTTSYYPACNALTERFNKTLIQIISKYVASNLKDWDLYLHSALFAYRTTVHNTTKYSPYYMLHGREPRLLPDLSLYQPPIMSRDTEEHFQHTVKSVKLAHQLAKENIEKQQLRMKLQFDKKSSVRSFNVGDKVLVYTPKTKKGLSKKLLHFWHGPYVITEQLSPVNYKIQAMHTPSKSEVVHVNKLKPFYECELLIDQNEEELLDYSTDTANMKRILSTTEFDGDTYYEIQWKDDSPNRFIHEDDVPIQLIKDYERENNDPNITRDEMPSDEQTDNTQKNVSNTGNSTLRLPHSINLLMILVLFLPLLLADYFTNTIYLGPLYDCTDAQPLGVYEFPRLQTCRHNHYRKLHSKIQVFRADIYQYHPYTTIIPIWHCKSYQYTYVCDENFWGTKVKYSHHRQIQATPQQCITEVKSIQTGTTTLQTRNAHVYTTENTPWFQCKWLQKITHTKRVTVITKYFGQIRGANRKLFTKLTDTNCTRPVNKTSDIYFTCQPTEDLTSLIIYKIPTTHQFTNYRHLGHHTVKVLSSFVLISSLKIGGIITKTDLAKTFMILDNGIILKKISFHGDFRKNLVNDLGKEPSQESQRISLHVANMFMAIRNLIVTEFENTCFIQNEISQLVNWLVTKFPSEVSNYLHPKPGLIVVPAGDALLISKCKNITRYRIDLTRQIGSNCYMHFPVQIQINNTRFLSLHDKRLITNSQKIKCEHLPPLTFLKDHVGILHQIDSKGVVTKVTPQKFTPSYSKKVTLKRITDFDPTLFTNTQPQLEYPSLLYLISTTTDTLEQLRDIHHEQNSNLITGITKLVGQTIETAATGTSQIIGALGKSIKQVCSGVSDLDEGFIQTLGSASSDVIRATGAAVHDTESGIADIFGSISGLILYIIVFILIGTLCCVNRTPILRQLRSLLHHPENNNIAETTQNDKNLDSNNENAHINTEDNLRLRNVSSTFCAQNKETQIQSRLLNSRWPAAKI